MKLLSKIFFWLLITIAALIILPLALTVLAGWLIVSIVFVILAVAVAIILCIFL